MILVSRDGFRPETPCDERENGRWGGAQARTDRFAERRFRYLVLSSATALIDHVRGK
jgi:hypothetical protein